MQKQLPEKYYLDHYREFTSFILKTNAHLLTPYHVNLLGKIEKLDESSQCLLVRMLNRKSQIIAVNTLQYAEIEDVLIALKTLQQSKMIETIGKHTFTLWLDVLTKPELIVLCSELNVQSLPARSAKKSIWLDFAKSYLCYDSVRDHELLQSYLNVSIASDFEYFLFLFFNRLESNLSQFSMRDLGVMATQNSVIPSSYFDCLSQAQFAFESAKRYQQLNTLEEHELPIFAMQIVNETVSEDIGEQGEYRREKLFYKLACLLEKQHPELTLALLETCQSSKAKEKYVRMLYTHGKVEQCKLHLESILNSPNDELLLLFAKDFFLRKFEQKRTSLLTDQLRESACVLRLDEAYRGRTEQGVIDCYARKGIQAWHTENQLWLALFCLTFWQEIFEHEDSIAGNEFARYPTILKFNRLYDQLGDEIERKLNQLNDSQAFKHYVLQQFTRYLGQSNPLFYWHDQLLHWLMTLVEHVDVNSIAQILTIMTQDFKTFKSGFPDLMVLDGETLRFEEIKAPGDTLRANQLVVINKLEQCGFKVQIQKTQWQTDPEQSYVVVDVETTGGKKDYDRITEIGMVRIEKGEVVATWQSLVNPERRIPKYITELTGIDNTMVSDAPLFSSLVEQIQDFCQDAIFVAHNVNFDMGFFKKEFQRVGMDFYMPKLCTVQLARKYYPHFASYSLANLCASLGIELNNHHRALADAQAAAEILMMINAVRIEAITTNDKQ